MDLNALKNNDMNKFVNSINTQDIHGLKMKLIALLTEYHKKEDEFEALIAEKIKQKKIELGQEFMSLFKHNEYQGINYNGPIYMKTINNYTFKLEIDTPSSKNVHTYEKFHVSSGFTDIKSVSIYFKLKGDYKIGGHDVLYLTPYKSSKLDEQLVLYSICRIGNNNGLFARSEGSLDRILKNTISLEKLNDLMRQTKENMGIVEYNLKNIAKIDLEYITSPDRLVFNSLSELIESI